MLLFVHFFMVSGGLVVVPIADNGADTNEDRIRISFNGRGCYIQYVKCGMTVALN